MPKKLLTIGIFGIALLSACANVPAPLPPTATLPPTPIPPTATSTSLPPPTVTPFPTATLPPPPTPTPLPTSEEGEGTAEPTASEATPVAENATATLPATQATIPQKDELILVADFSSGWPTFEDVAARLYPANGQYVFDLGAGALRYLTTAAIDRADLYVQVEVTPDKCPSGGGYGLFFRFKDADNYYALTVFCDGRVTVYLRAGGTLNPDPFLDTTLPNGLSAVGPQTHRLGVLTSGSTFTIYFDDHVVGSFSSEARKKGDIALYAVSPRDARLVVAFDNLEVWSIR